MPGKAYLHVDLNPTPTINFAVCAVGAEFNEPGSGISEAKILYWVDRICADEFYEFEADSLFFPPTLLAAT